MGADGAEHDRLVDEAIDLVIRLQNDPENPITVEMVRQWCSRSREHERVWQHITKIHGASGKILTEQRKSERREKLGLTRRNLMIAGTLGIGAAASGSLLYPRVMRDFRADYITGTGEIRSVSLPDGSVATLGPDSAIALQYGEDARQIDLLDGMSFFDVTKDPEKPFRVMAGGVVATALGTAFDVSSDADIVMVGVDHGLVEVRASTSILAGGEKLGENDWVSFDASSGDVDRGKHEPGQVGAWRERLVIAERETVSALVARIGRWIPGKVVLADPYIGSMRVSGIFDLSDPQRALEAVVHPAGGRVHRMASFLTVISPL
ncbi:FecR family protein [Rhizobium sp. SYY.PMSO]|uniref:FecR family protein n=1 Tax=Rhizobium sp. SYY.PMSO TaxID=3382192 RepID=UPI00398FA302